MRLLDRIRDLVAVARAMLRPEEQIAEPVIVPGPLLKQHPAVQRAAQRADRIAEAIDRLTSERSGILRVSPLEFCDLVAITDARVVVRDGVPEFEAHCSFGPVTVRLADKERDHAQADPDPRRGADDRGGDPAARSSTSELMSAIEQARASLAQGGTVVDAAAVIACDAIATILEPCARILWAAWRRPLILDTAEHGLSVGDRVRVSYLPDGTHLREGVATVLAVDGPQVTVTDDIVAIGAMDYVYPELDYTPDIAPHVIAPCPTCGAPARTGAVHYASVTAQRPCPASWKGRGP